jgi:hypothetical protein
MKVIVRKDWNWHQISDIKEPGLLKQPASTKIYACCISSSDGLFCQQLSASIFNFLSEQMVSALNMISPGQGKRHIFVAQTLSVHLLKFAAGLAKKKS